MKKSMILLLSVCAFQLVLQPADLHAKSIESQRKKEREAKEKKDAKKNVPVIVGATGPKGQTGPIGPRGPGFPVSTTLDNLTINVSTAAASEDVIGTWHAFVLDPYHSVVADSGELSLSNPPENLDLVVNSPIILGPYTIVVCLDSLSTPGTYQLIKGPFTVTFGNGICLIGNPNIELSNAGQHFETTVVPVTDLPIFNSPVTDLSVTELIVE